MHFVSHLVSLIVIHSNPKNIDLLFVIVDSQNDNLFAVVDNEDVVEKD